MGKHKDLIPSLIPHSLSGCNTVRKMFGTEKTNALRPAEKCPF